MARRMLEMRGVCEKCAAHLNDAGEALICSFECTFCVDCGQDMDHRCPNCGGELVVRPRRRAQSVVGQQGVAHFGVVLRNRKEFDALVARVNASGVAWITRPELHTDPALSAKVGGKLSDPSGNVIELKYYEDVTDLERG